MRTLLPIALAGSLALVGCATRPINPPIIQVDPGHWISLFDADEFTSLAYGLYGDKLFEDYEQRFLKRDVQGQLIAGLFNPTHWPRLWSSNWGRSEMAAELYDKILFNGATFADLDRNKSLLVLASATDISTGAQVTFDQYYFDAMFSNLDTVPVPRAKRLLDELRALTDSNNRPHIHLVDGGVADNVSMRAVLMTLEMAEARQRAGIATPFDSLRRIIVIVVNLVSSTRTHWNESEGSPGLVSLGIQASVVPIDHYS